MAILGLGLGLGFMLTDVTRLNFFEVARAAFFSKYSPRHEVRSSARRTSPLTMVKGLCKTVLLQLQNHKNQSHVKFWASELVKAIFEH